MHFDYLISRRRQPSTYRRTGDSRTDDPKRQEMLEDDTAVLSRENFTKNISISRKKENNVTSLQGRLLVDSEENFSINNVTYI